MAMPALIVYLLKVNTALLLFYAAYRFGLRHLTFYYLNRAFLVFGILFSSVYPLANLSGLFVKHEVLSRQLVVMVPDWHAVAPIIAQKAEGFDYWQIPIAIFWMGAALMAIRLTVQFVSLYRVYKKSSLGEYEGQVFRGVDDDVNPFSFWQTIYLNPGKHTQAELKAIIKHEQVHVRQWHTLDVLLAELSTVFYWFNPGVWLMKQAVKENLEFITDRAILKSGMDEKAYQYSLVKVSGLKQGAAMVNNFNFLTIKKRIMMMNKKRSSSAQVTRYVVLLPLVILLALIFTVSKAELSTGSFGKLVNKVLPKSILKTIEAHVGTSVIVKKPLGILTDTGRKTTQSRTNQALSTAKGNSDAHTISSAGPSSSSSYGSGTIQDSTAGNKKQNMSASYGKGSYTYSTGFTSSHAIGLEPRGDVNFQKNSFSYQQSGVVYAITMVDSSQGKGFIEEQKKYGTKAADLRPGASKSDDITNVTAVFDGEVLKVVQISGTYLVLVRKDDNFGAYSNLSSVSVAKGNKVGAGQIIGTVAIDPATNKSGLTYELYKGANRVYPPAETLTTANNNGLIYRINPDNIDMAECNRMVKLFKDNGFKLQIHAKANGSNSTKGQPESIDELKIAIKSNTSGNEASAVYQLEDLKAGHYAIFVKANKQTGAVSVFSEKP
jgi:murein DD-endopeptidase MepM/ murein hydrolase activator NlpD